MNQIDFDKFDTRYEFSEALEKGKSIKSFTEAMRDEMTSTATRVLGSYLFGEHRDYAAADHFLAELTKPAATRIVELHRRGVE